MELVTVYGILVALVAALLVYLQLMEGQKETSFGNLLAQFRLEHSNINDQLAAEKPGSDAWIALTKHRNFLMLQYRKIHNSDMFREAILEVKDKKNRKINWLTVCFVKLIEWNTFFYKMVFGALVPNTSFKTDIGNSRLITTLMFVILVTGIAISTKPPSWEYLNIASLGLHRANGWFALFLGLSTSLVFARLMFHHSIIQKDLIEQWKSSIETITGRRETLAAQLEKLREVSEAKKKINISTGADQSNNDSGEGDTRLNGQSDDATDQPNSE